MRNTFPLPSERKSEPRFDGSYRDPEAGEIRFAHDGSLSWGGDSGEWRVHGDTLRLQVARRDCEGAIDDSAVYLLCTEREGRAGRSQFVLAFTSEA